MHSCIELPHVGLYIAYIATYAHCCMYNWLLFEEQKAAKHVRGHAIIMTLYALKNNSTVCVSEQTMQKARSKRVCFTIIPRTRK